MSEALERPRSAFLPIPQRSRDIVVTAVPHEFLAEEFIRTGPLMEMVAKDSNGRFLVEDLFQYCDERRMILWIVARMLEDRKREYLAVLFTSVREFPRKRAFRVDFLAGSRVSEWLGPVAQAFERAARAERCDLMEGGGRLGWSRVFKRLGLKPKACFFEEEII